MLFLPKKINCLLSDYLMTYTMISRVNIVFSVIKIAYSLHINETINDINAI
jgi:hypothetical protein